MCVVVVEAKFYADGSNAQNLYAADANYHKQLLDLIDLTVSSRHRAGRALFSFPRQFFPRGPYISNRRAVRRFLDARAERAAGRARAKRPEWAGAACLYGVHCRCCCSLIVKEKLN